MISHLGGGDAGNRDGTPGDGEEKRAGEGGLYYIESANCTVRREWIERLEGVGGKHLERKGWGCGGRGGGGGFWQSGGLCSL